MGFRTGAVLSSASFILGVLFVCFTIDHRLLYVQSGAPLSEQTIQDGFHFYTTFFNAPPAIKTLLHSMMGVGILGLAAKLSAMDESAKFFDGTSLAGFVFMIALYASVTIPSLRTIVNPVPEVDTLQDRVEAMKLLAAGNTIAIAILGAILCLQAGQEYARRVEEKENAKLLAKERETADGSKKSSHEKKTE